MQKFNFMDKKIGIAVAVIAIAGLGYYYRGLFAAASVNGDFISRLSVIRELEKRSGKATLEGLVIESLILGEFRKRGVLVPSGGIDPAVSDSELKEYIKAQKITFPKEGASESREQVRNQLRGQKFNNEASAWLESLKSNSSIKYFTWYGN